MAVAKKNDVPDNEPNGTPASAPVAERSAVMIAMSIDQGQKLVDYLKKHPYEEVSELINTILNAKQVSVKF